MDCAGHVGTLGEVDGWGYDSSSNLHNICSNRHARRNQLPPRQTNSHLLRPRLARDGSSHGGGGGGSAPRPEGSEGGSDEGGDLFFVCVCVGGGGVARHGVELWVGYLGRCVYGQGVKKERKNTLHPFNG